MREDQAGQTISRVLQKQPWRHFPKQEEMRSPKRVVDYQFRMKVDVVMGSSCVRKSWRAISAMSETGKSESVVHEGSLKRRPKTRTAEQGLWHTDRQR